MRKNTYFYQTEQAAAVGQIWYHGGNFSRVQTKLAPSSTEVLMPQYRSKTSTHGRNMAGARALWRATGMKDDDFQKPIIAVVNSFTDRKSVV